MFRLDYLSCLLTILSTIMVGRRLWQGWIVAGVNSVLICVIGIRTGQTGFIPANIFCLGLYAYNLMRWTSDSARDVAENRSADQSATTFSGRVRARLLQ